MSQDQISYSNLIHVWQSHVNVFGAKNTDENIVVSETQKEQREQKIERNKDLKKHRQRKGRNKSTEK